MTRLGRALLGAAETDLYGLAVFAWLLVLAFGTLRGWP